MVEALHLWKSDFLLCGGIVDGPESLEEVLIVVVMCELRLNAPERGWRTIRIPLKAFQDIGLLEDDNGTTGSTTAGLFFLKRLRRTALTPPLNFFLGDALDDLALVEEW